MNALQLIGILMIVWLAGMTSASGQAYLLSVSEASGAPGTSVSISVDLDINGAAGGLPADGWSFGLCSNDAEITPTQALMGSAVTPLSPDFVSVDVTVAGGLTVGVVIRLLPPAVTLPLGTGQELLVVDYDLNGSVGTTSLITVCSTLGTPPIEALIVATPANSGPLEFTPSTTIGSISIEDPSPTATFEIATVQPAAGGTATIPVTLSHQTSEGVVGFSFGLTWNSSELVGTSFNIGSDLAAIRGGQGPVFFGVNLIPAGGTGLTLGMLTDFNVPPQMLPVGNDLEVGLLTATVLPPFTPAATLPIDFTQSLGSPPITVEVVSRVNGLSFPFAPTTVAGGVDLDVPFIRGDASGDGAVTIVDVVATLDAIFLSSEPLDCADMLDANDDGGMGILDAVYLLEFLFLSGAPPAEPFLSCGPDPTGSDALGCNGIAPGCP